MISGIYVHLPYCASRCAYCAFVVTTDATSREAYLAALEGEADLLAPEAAGRAFDTVYFGGGTPSLLPPEAIIRLLDGLRARFAIAAGSEVTLESNPEDVTDEAAAAWAGAGVTRVSVGVQSLDDRELAAVGRRHDASRALAAVESASRAGVTVSADLILGLPEQTAESFRRSLDGLCRAGVGHVSIYLLETEKSRSIEQDRRERPERYLPDDAQADAWLEAGDDLRSRGFEHYEISNWARPGQAARHNVKYWERTPTLGLGVSAHELWAERRRANVSGLDAYLAGIASGRRPLALDKLLADDEAQREAIVLGLRLAKGLPAGDLDAWISARGDAKLPADYAAWFEEGILIERTGQVAFTERGFLVSNEVLCRFV